MTLASRLTFTESIAILHAHRGRSGTSLSTGKSDFDGWGQDCWKPQDFDPVARIDVSPRRVGHVLPSLPSLHASTISRETRITLLLVMDVLFFVELIVGAQFLH